MKADPRAVVMHLIRATKEGDHNLRDFLAEEVIRHLERGDELEAAVEVGPVATAVIYPGGRRELRNGEPRPDLFPGCELRPLFMLPPAEKGESRA